MWGNSPKRHFSHSQERVTVSDEVKDEEGKEEVMPPPICKEFPVMMDIRTEAGIDRSLNTLHQCFPRGTIPVVCPKCGTKNNITLKSLEEHIWDRDPKQKSETFDECTKCGRSLVFESPMGPKREHEEPKSRREHIDALKLAADKKVDEEEPAKRWDSKAGKWVPK